MADIPDSLLAGYQTFMSEHFASETARYKELAEKGQAPETLVIACCDSRAAPETIFNSAPGEMFVLPRGWRGEWTIHEQTRKIYTMVAAGV